ncbi:MAG: hypothetical protein K5672_01620 [Bacteroidaceae bacterium]|nr:hypothetical protein [Bacteroidaceae bacterium]
MTDYEVREMQRLIDAGIQLAHKRLLARACFEGQVLVFAQDGKVIEKIPEGSVSSPVLEGDPLLRHRFYRD